MATDKPPTSQRETIRKLWRRYGGDLLTVVRKYAEAERRGGVQRTSNRYFREPEEYARSLVSDGLLKGWLHKS
jgi:hypothetical protein